MLAEMREHPGRSALYLAMFATVPPGSLLLLRAADQGMPTKNRFASDECVRCGARNTQPFPWAWGASRFLYIERTRL